MFPGEYRKNLNQLNLEKCIHMFKKIFNFLKIMILIFKRFVN
jgi:hypothetical protein